MNTETKQAGVLKLLCLGVSYAFSYAYIEFFNLGMSHLQSTVYLCLLALGVCIWLEMTIRQKVLAGDFEPPKMMRIEPRFWEGILLLLSLSTYKSDMPVLTMFFIHMVVFYMALCGTGHLLSDRSSCLMPLDLINGIFRMPFRNFFARILTWYELLRRHHEEKEDREERSVAKIFGIIVVLGLFFIFFLIALENLSSVDGHFREVINWIDRSLQQISISESIEKFLCSLPIGACLFGAFQGGVRLDQKYEKEYHARLTSDALRFRFMPDMLLSFVIGVFALVYLAFFISQSSYMFSAFAGVLPEEFTASEYAVSGFQELINVVVLNFVLLICVRIFGSHERRLLRIMSVILMVESMVFATISASKIILYMSRFGYTLSRTLGLWGTVVVFAGAICAIVHLLKNKRTFLPWLWFSAGSYVVMQFITWAFTGV